MTIVRSQIVQLLALSATAVLIGCGSSATSTAPPQTGALTHSELVSRADAICKQVNERIAAAKKIPTVGQGPPYADAVRLLNDELPILTSELSALQHLQASGADREAFGDYVRAAAGELASAVYVRNASARSDAAGYRSGALELLTQSTRSVQTANRLGLVECAKKPEPQG